MSFQESPYISVVIPTYREADKIDKTVRVIDDYLKRKGWNYEIIAVDDASPDNTFDILNGLKQSYPKLKTVKMEKNGRKAGAVQKGILESNGEYILFTDADLSTSIEQVENLLKPLFEGGYDIAIGSRGLRESNLLKSQSAPRKLIGKLYGKLANILLVYGVNDTQCGFKCFKGRAAHKIFERLTSLTPAFDIEILLIASMLGFRVAEIPVTWVHNPETRLKYNIFSSIKVFLELLKLKLRWKIIFPYKIKK